MTRDISFIIATIEASMADLDHAITKTRHVLDELTDMRSALRQQAKQIKRNPVQRRFLAGQFHPRDGTVYGRVPRENDDAD